MISTNEKSLGKYKVLKTLGSGGTCKVKLGFDPSTNLNVALKILKDDLSDKTNELVIQEVKIMQTLQHAHVLEQIETGKDLYKKPKGNKEVDYVVLSIAAQGEVFDFIASSGPFSEPVARYYFKQALEGLDYCHSNGVAHRDMKPENLLLDENFNLKIADFGFAGPMEGRDGSGFLHTRLGTKNYMAPEIHEGKAYVGSSVDLFALGIILFIMVAQAPPFNTAETNKDPFYRAIS